MKIKPLRSMVGSYGHIRKGRVASVPDSIAQQLVKRGLAVPAQMEKAQEVAKSASPRPSKDPRPGGQTGEAKPSSSLPADQAPKPLTSTKSKDDAE